MNEYLPILAIETSASLCSAALFNGVDEYYESSINKKHVHSEKLFDLIDDVLNQAGINVNEAKSIAVSMGPGSFTGLRIGVAAAKGLAIGRDIPIIPIPTFDALAYEISKFLPKGTKFGIANTVNRTELYAAGYKCTDKPYENIEALSIILKDNYKEFIRDYSVVFGSFQKKTGRLVRIIEAPSACSIAEWSYFFGKDLLTFDYDYLEPDYLKTFVAKVKK